MKLRNYACRIEIDQRKLVEYALNPANDKGQHKARVFAASLGYTSEDYAGLQAQIVQQALDAEAEL